MRLRGILNHLDELGDRDGLWTPSVFGSAVVLECRVAGGTPLPSFRVTELTHRYVRLGEDTARSLGLPIGLMRWVLIGVLALCTATSVAQAGLIAFVGLVAPHVVRSRAALPHGVLLVRSAAMGGLLLCAADVMARMVMAPRELPVGILTAVLGGGYLLWRLHSQPQRASP